LNIAGKQIDLGHVYQNPNVMHQAPAAYRSDAGWPVNWGALKNLLREMRWDEMAGHKSIGGWGNRREN
jgi:hypothetical protein